MDISSPPFYHSDVHELCAMQCASFQTSMLMRRPSIFKMEWGSICTSSTKHAQTHKAWSCVRLSYKHECESLLQGTQLFTKHAVALAAKSDQRRRSKSEWWQWKRADRCVLSLSNSHGDTQTTPKELRTLPQTAALWVEELLFPSLKGFIILLILDQWGFTNSLTACMRGITNSLTRWIRGVTNSLFSS